MNESGAPRSNAAATRVIMRGLTFYCAAVVLNRNRPRRAPLLGACVRAYGEWEPGQSRQGAPCEPA